MTTTILKATQASELLAAIPALLGFQPHDSVVVVPFRGTRTVGAMRLDLPAIEDTDELASVVTGLVYQIEDVTGAAIVTYGTPTQAETVSAALTSHITSRSLDIIDTFTVTGAEWARTGEHKKTPIAPVPAHIAALAAETDQQAGGTLPEVDPALAAEVATRIPGADAIREALSGVDLIDAIEDALSFDASAGDAEHAAQIIAGLNHPALRDVALVQWARGEAVGREAFAAQVAWEAGAPFPTHLAAIMCGEGEKPSGERVRTALSLCRTLAALAPVEASTGPLVAAGWLSWAIGRSTHAEGYVRRALAIDPTRGMAQLIADMVSNSRIPAWAFTR